MNLRDSLNNNAARVTNRDQLYGFSVTETENKFELRNGKAFNLNTGTVNLTSANESAVAYLKNNSNDKLIINSMIVGIGASTGGSATAEIPITIERNPTAGTIIDNAVAPLVTASNKASNRNFGSSNTETVDFYKGAETYTVTASDGDLALIYGFASNRIVVPEISFELQKGNSVAVLIDPMASNTSLNVYVAFEIFVAEDLF